MHARKEIELKAKRATSFNRGLKMAKTCIMIFTALLIAGTWGCDSGNNNDFAGLVVINEEGRRIYIECRGTGLPLVVFVAGLQNRAETWSTTVDPLEQSVVSAIAEKTRVCVYDRPGTFLETGEGEDDFDPSRSERVDQPITPADAAQDLRDLLTAIGEPGPVILVGHSAGGTFALYYTCLFPKVVAGLILIDYLPYKIRNHILMTPKLWEIWKEVNTLPEEAIKRFPDIERLDHEPSFEQVSEAPQFKLLPLVVLSATKLPDVPPPVVQARFTQMELDDLLKVLQDVLLDTRGDLVDEVPGAEHITDTDSGHFIHQEQPGLVTDKILDVLNAVRKGCSSLNCD